MAFFRHPKTHKERKSDQALRGADAPSKPAGRLRSGKSGSGLPTERSDKIPAALTDRARGKASHSPARKAKAKSKTARLKGD